jgi:hypothetical protein
VLAGADQKDIQEAEEKTLISAGRSLLKKRLTGPTLLEMSGRRGGLNGSTQHQIETQAQGFQQLRVVRER